jgi:uroporphyrinogen-III synthase
VGKVPLLPLEGFTVGVTADRRAAEQAELLRRRGATVMSAPAITTTYLGSDERLRAATDAVLRRPPTHLVVTTAIGLRAWMEAAQSWGIDDDLLHGLRDTAIVARGPKASAAVQALGLEVWRSAPDERMQGVSDVLRTLSPQARVAVQCFGDDEANVLDLLGGVVGDLVAIPVYRWEAPADDRRLHGLVSAVLEGRVDAVTFTSAPAVRNLFAAAAVEGATDTLRGSFNAGVVAACVGPACAAAARAVGIDDPTAPDVGRLGLMVRALSERLTATRRCFTLAGRPVVAQGTALAVGDGHVSLTRREADVLQVLSEKPGAVVSSSTLLRRVWGGAGDDHAVGVTVGRLRRKLTDAGAGAALVTVPRRGYRLEP